MNNQLTKREIDVLCLVGRGWTNEAIAKELRVASAKVIRGYLFNIRSKLYLRDRIQVALFAHRGGYVGLADIDFGRK